MGGSRQLLGHRQSKVVLGRWWSKKGGGGIDNKYEEDEFYEYLCIMKKGQVGKRKRVERGMIGRG